MEKMNRISFALFVSLLIHLLLLVIFLFISTIEIEKEKPKESKENRIKISLKELPSKTKKTTPKKVKTTTKFNNKIIKPKQKKIKKIIKKPMIIKKPKVIQKPKIIEKEIVKKEITKPIVKKTIIIPKKVKKKDTPSSWMYEDKSKEDEQKKVKKRRVTRNSSINQNIKKLYGDEFAKLSPAQQKYIVDNTEIMRRITQKVLNRVARVNIKENLNVNRTNVIEFYLHPNGDMSDFRFLKQSGYFILDHTTKETIEYAYSRYPRPSEKVLIRYNVMYNLAY